MGAGSAPHDPPDDDTRSSSQDLHQLHQYVNLLLLGRMPERSSCKGSAQELCMGVTACTRPDCLFYALRFRTSQPSSTLCPTASPPLSTAPSEHRESNLYTTTPPHATGRPARPPAAADVARDRMIFLKPLSLSLICHLRRAPPRLASHPPSLRIEHSPSRAAPRRQPSCRQSPHARCTIFVPSSPVALCVRFVYPSFRPVLFVFVFVFVFFRDLGRTRPPTPVLP